MSTYQGRCVRLHRCCSIQEMGRASGNPTLKGSQPGRISNQKRPPWPAMGCLICVWCLSGVSLLTLGYSRGHRGGGPGGAGPSARWSSPGPQGQGHRGVGVKCTMKGSINVLVTISSCLKHFLPALSLVMFRHVSFVVPGLSCLCCE